MVLICSIIESDILWSIAANPYHAIDCIRDETKRKLAKKRERAKQDRNHPEWGSNELRPLFHSAVSRSARLVTDNEVWVVIMWSTV